MILLKKNEAKSIIVTLNDSKTIAQPNYLFNFTSTFTNQVVSITFSYDEDLSNYPERFNEFEIPETLFSNAPEGQYTYEVYQVGEPDILLENGKMELLKETETIRNGYESTVTRSGYGG